MTREHKIELVRKLKEKKKREVTNSLWEFSRYFWDAVVKEDELRENWHMVAVCNELQKVGERVIERKAKLYDLVINVPPGSSKSTLATVLFPAWLWVRDASLRIITTSHSGKLAIDHATLSRDIFDDEKFRSMFPELFKMRQDIDAKSHYKNSKGGERRATSVGSKITGNHAHIIIIDDAIDPKGVKSQVQIEGVNEYLNKTLSSRKVDKSVTPMVLIMQRLHENDPTGNWIQQAQDHGRRLRVVCFPATSEDFLVSIPDAKVTWRGKTRTVKQWYAAAGGLLDPVRMSRDVLQEAQSTLGDREYAGQFGQQPRLMEGNVLKDRHLPVVDWHQVPAGVRMSKRFFVVDTAYEEKTESDYSAALLCTKFENNLYLLDYTRGKLAFSDLVDALVRFYEENVTSASPMFIEPKASGISIVQYLKRHTVLPVIKYKMPGGDKMSRTNANEPHMAARRVFLLRGPWNEQFIDECKGFPNAAHDEAIDCLNMACELAFNRVTTKRRTISA